MMPEQDSRLNFLTARERLLAELRNRVQNGELTERACARRLGLSQPHINNVLRGRRKLSPEIADRILNYFHSSLLDLFEERELQSYLNSLRMPEAAGDVDVLRNSIGPGQEWDTALESNLRYRSPLRLTASPEIFLARLRPDARMFSVVGGGDMALLDSSAAACLGESPSSLFVVVQGKETMLRWIRSGFAKLYLAHEQNLNRPADWRAMPTGEGERIHIVKARMLWLGEEKQLRRPKRGYSSIR